MKSFAVIRCQKKKKWQKSRVLMTKKTYLSIEYLEIICVGKIKKRRLRKECQKLENSVDWFLFDKSSDLYSALHIFNDKQFDVDKALCLCAIYAAKEKANSLNPHSVFFVDEKCKIANYLPLFINSCDEIKIYTKQLAKYCMVCESIFYKYGTEPTLTCRQSDCEMSVMPDSHEFTVCGKKYVANVDTLAKKSGGVENALIRLCYAYIINDFTAVADDCLSFL